MAVLALGAVLGWWAMRSEPAATPLRPTPAHPTHADAIDAGTRGPEIAPTLPTTTTATTTVASATPRPPSDPLDPCGSADDDPAIVRPSIGELLRLSTQELNDRMRARLGADDASAALREGWAAIGDPARENEALTMLSRAPDRVDDGFDVYVAACMALATHALAAHDDARAEHLAGRATAAAPNEPLPHVVLYLVAQHAGSDVRAVEHLARAFALLPDEPSIALSLAWNLEHEADSATALAAFDAYLAAHPEDRAMTRRRARVAMHAHTFAGGVQHARGGITVVGTRALASSEIARIEDVVGRALDRGARLLGVPRREAVVVFVHPSAEAMRRATCTQAWTGAVFDGALEVDVETLASPAGEAALVHESFHAAIHPAVPNVPTWLDEGLAQYASGEEGPAHAQSYQLMVREGTWIPFASMNDAFLVIDDSSDAGLAYHQARLMVDWLVDRRGERGIADAARFLIEGGDPTRVLSEAAHAELDGQTLLAFASRRLASMPTEGHAPPR